MELFENLTIPYFMWGAFWVVIVAGLVSIRKKLELVDKMQHLDVEDIGALKGLSEVVIRFSKTVDRLEDLSLRHEISKNQFKMELDYIKDRVDKLEKMVRELN